LAVAGAFAATFAVAVVFAFVVACSSSKPKNLVILTEVAHGTL
jgi:hypothetical protein